MPFWLVDRCLCYWYCIKITSPATVTLIHSQLVSFCWWTQTYCYMYTVNYSFPDLGSTIVIFILLALEREVLQWMAVAHQNKSCLLRQSHSGTLIFTWLPVIYLSFENSAPCLRLHSSLYFVHHFLVPCSLALWVNLNWSTLFTSKCNLLNLAVSCCQETVVFSPGVSKQGFPSVFKKQLLSS